MPARALPPARALLDRLRARRVGAYDASYYGEGRDPADRAGRSGYERYTRATSNADAAAYLVWRFLPIGRTLDVGCARGFVVEALRELGADAYGVDASPWAIRHPAPGARGRLRRADLRRHLPFRPRSFDVVTAFETLEHLPPAQVPAALDGIRRVCAGWLVATIPSFGPNPFGPPGWLDGKVRPEARERLYALGPDWDGPVPFEDLARDEAGQPLEGHLTIASFRWWTQRFAEAGFIRCPELEARWHPRVARFGLTTAWNLYVLRLPGTPLPPAELRDPAALAERERATGLDQRRPAPVDLELLEAALGPEAVALATASPPA